MKKFFKSAAIVMGAGLLLLFCSCLPKKEKLPPRLKLVTSMPLIYDWARNIIDENTNTSLYLSLIVKAGINYHNFIPSEPEKASIQTADLFIYVGGSTEVWAQELAGEKSLRLTDFCGDDSHSLLSPKMAMECCKQICEQICLLDPANSQSYRKNCDNYLAQLELLDQAYTMGSQNVKDKTFIICDRFPFKSLFEEYKINYISACEDCPAPASFKKPDPSLAQMLGSKIDQLGAPAVYVMEDSDKKLAKSAIGYSKNPKCDTLILDSFESTNLSQLFSGKNYINVMQSNLTLLH